MGLSHADFFRTLPAAMGEHAYCVDGVQVHSGDASGPRQLLIELQPERERRIALLSVPTTDVRFCFRGYDQAAVKAFMDFFMSRYQRGGG